MKLKQATIAVAIARTRHGKLKMLANMIGKIWQLGLGAKND